uniref:Tegument protein UL37 n=1 Tax=Cardioderma bat herpesvirus TaxID=3141914 RepID=A0AAU7E1T6_9VIRU
MKQSSLRGQTALNILAKVEIRSVTATSINASKIKQFLLYVPRDGHHFAFIHNNTLYYLLGHITAQDNVAIITTSLLSEFKKYVNRLEYADGRNRPPGNSNVIDILEELNRQLGVIQSRIAHHGETDALVSGSRGSKRQSSRVQETKDTLDEVVLLTSMAKRLINCRAVAELVDETYHATLSWFEDNLRYAQDPSEAETDLDTILKMYHFYKYHRQANRDLAVKFKAFAQASNKKRPPFTITDVQEIHQPGSEYMRDVSYKLAAESFVDHDYSNLLFPMISTDVEVLRYFSARNLFFHEGLVYRLLHTPASKLAIPREQLDSLMEFCGAVSDRFFRAHATAPANTASIRSIASRARELANVGLNAATTKTYIQMSLTRAPTVTASTHAEKEINELVQQLLMILYNAYMFFVCLGCYSPTFLFHNRRKVIMEQQRSILVGSHTELNGIWENVSLNTNRIFHTWFTEEEFNEQIEGTSFGDRLYLYRDLVNKWGEMLFTFSTENTAMNVDVSNSVTADAIVKACAGVDETEASYDGLIPLSTHGEFAQIFVNVVVIPQFNDIMGLEYQSFKEHGYLKLMKLIYAIQLLLPEQLVLYQNLSSLYNLMYLAPKIHTGAFNAIYVLMHDTNTALEDIGGKKTAFKPSILVDLVIQSVLYNITTTINPIMENTLRSNEKTVTSYLDHVKRCAAILLTEGRLDFHPHVVTLKYEGKTVMTVPMAEFHATCLYMKKRGDALSDKMAFIENSLRQIRYRLGYLSDGINTVKRYVAGHSAYRQFLKFLSNLTMSIKSIEERLSYSVSSCQKTLFLFSATVRRLQRAVDAFSPDNIAKNGVAECTTEAIGIRDTSSKLHKIPRQATERPAKDIYEVVNYIFKTPPHVSTDHVVYGMSSEVNRPLATLMYSNVFHGRFAHLEDKSKIAGWYVSTKERAQHDLINPLNVKADIVVEGIVSLPSSVQRDEDVRSELRSEQPGVRG